MSTTAPLATASRSALRRSLALAALATTVALTSVACGSDRSTVRTTGSSGPTAGIDQVDVDQVDVDQVDVDETAAPVDTASPVTTPVTDIESLDERPDDQSRLDAPLPVTLPAPVTAPAPLPPVIVVQQPVQPPAPVVTTRPAPPATQPAPPTTTAPTTTAPTTTPPTTTPPTTTPPTTTPPTTAPPTTQPAPTRYRVDIGAVNVKVSAACMAGAASVTVNGEHFITGRALKPWAAIVLPDNYFVVTAAGFTEIETLANATVGFVSLNVPGYLGRETAFVVNGLGERVVSDHRDLVSANGTTQCAADTQVTIKVTAI